MTDALTGLPTHRDGLRDAIVAHGTACCLVDIDAFIWINDQQGHLAGDRVLADVARFLAQFASDNRASVFRIGGDEFLLLLPQLDAAALQAVAAGIVEGVRALEIPYLRRDRPLRKVLEVNVVVLRATGAFAERVFSQFGITSVAMDWVGEHIFQEKTRLDRDAGVVLDLSDSPDCPWAG